MCSAPSRASLGVWREAQGLGEGLGSALIFLSCPDTSLSLSWLSHPLDSGCGKGEPGGVNTSSLSSRGQRAELETLPANPLEKGCGRRGCTCTSGGSRKRQVCFSRTPSSGRASTLRRQIVRSCDFFSKSRGGLRLLYGGQRAVREGHGRRGWEGTTCQSRQEQTSPEQWTLLGLRHPLPSRLTRLVCTLCLPGLSPLWPVAGLLRRRLSRGFVTDSLARLGAGACRGLHPKLSSAGRTDLSSAPVTPLRHEPRLPAPEKAAQLRLPLASRAGPCRLAGTMPHLAGWRLTPREPLRGAGAPTRGWR